MRYRVLTLLARVRETPDAKAPIIARLVRGEEFSGRRALSAAWVARDAGGYVKRSSVEVIGA